MRISDWSSDVCSSDLAGLRQLSALRRPLPRFLMAFWVRTPRLHAISYTLSPSFDEEYSRSQPFGIAVTARHYSRLGIIKRSEDSRVGKECGRKCRSRWWAYH